MDVPIYFINHYYTNNFKLKTNKFMSPKNIIETLIQQHRELKSSLEQAQKTNHKEDAEQIISNLNDFKNLLIKHLDIEDNTFYPEIIQKMEEKKMDIEQTKTFIAEMKDIAKTVMEFLEKYSETSKIQEDENFPEELETIYRTYLIRMTSEEDGVYLY